MIKQIFFDGVETDCNVAIDRNGEWLCENPDGRFVKFPPVSEADLDDLIASHNALHSEAPVLAEVAEEPPPPVIPE